MNVYDNPKYYEIAFSYRNIINELDFFEYLINKFSKIKVKNILELACGTSPYLKELDRRHYQYTGIDLNQNMVKYVKLKASKNNIPAKVIKADMINFSIDNYYFDMVYTLLGSLYVKSDKELFRHLDCTCQVLQRGGLYILNDVVTTRVVNKKPDIWSISKGPIKVTTTYKSSVIDKKNKIQLENLMLVVCDKKNNKTIRSQIIHKYFEPDELNKLIKQHGKFKVVGSYSNFNIGKDASKEDRPILVLRKI